MLQGNFTIALIKLFRPFDITSPKILSLPLCSLSVSRFFSVSNFSWLHSTPLQWQWHTHTEISQLSVFSPLQIEQRTDSQFVVSIIYIEEILNNMFLYAEYRYIGQGAELNKTLYHFELCLIMNSLFIYIYLDFHDFFKFILLLLLPFHFEQQFKSNWELLSASQYFRTEICARTFSKIGGMKRVKEENRNSFGKIWHKSNWKKRKHVKKLIFKQNNVGFPVIFFYKFSSASLHSSFRLVLCISMFKFKYDDCEIIEK